MDDLTARLVAQLKVEEGVRLKLYTDTKGLLSIGIGRNIQGIGIRPDEAELMLSNDIADMIKFLSQYDWFNSESEVRKAALVDMSFMGPEKLLHFVNMIADLKAQDFTGAASEVRNSQWYKDVGPNRGERVAKMIEFGAWPTDIPYAVVAVS